MSEALGPVLNPGLVAALRRLGSVAVGNPGESADVTLTHRVINGEVRRVADVRHWGEYYRVNCPICRDTRRRLNICNLWGTADPVTGRPMLHLVRCQNEDCFDDRDSRHNLMVMLFGPRKPPSHVLPGLVSAATDTPSGSVARPRRSSLPGGFLSVADSACPTRAIHYLESRGFDVAELATRWNVGYSPASRTLRPHFTDRIVVPIYDVVRPVALNKPPKSVLVGWQARRLDDDQDGQGKYLFATGTPASRVLYGLPQALSTCGPIVVCEGVTDAWRLGSHAVAIFGKTLCPAQLTLLAMFDARPLVLFLDRDAKGEAKAIRKQIRAARAARGDKSRVVIAAPPGGRKDAAECLREEAWQAIARVLGWTDRRLSRELRES